MTTPSPHEMLIERLAKRTYEFMGDVTNAPER